MRHPDRQPHELDDVIVFSHDAAQSWRTAREVDGFLASELRLALKTEATVVAPVRDGVPFLGCRIFPHTIRLGRRKLVRWCRRFRDAVRAHEADIEPAPAQLRSLASVHAHVAAFDTGAFRRRVACRLIKGTSAAV